MKNSILTRIFLLLLLTGIFSSCLRDDVFMPWQMNLSAEGVEAQLWYNKQVDSEGIQLIDESGKKMPVLQPNWTMLYFDEDDQYRVTEVNLEGVRKKHPNYEENGMEYVERFVIGSPECMAKFHETNDPRYQALNIRLIIRTDKETDNREGFIMMVYPDLSYLEPRLSNPLKDISYIRRDKEFSGMVQYYHLDGSYSNGWKYIDGKAYALILNEEE